jgi:hypothetical protein
MTVDRLVHLTGRTAPWVPAVAVATSAGISLALGAVWFWVVLSACFVGCAGAGWTVSRHPHGPCVWCVARYNAGTVGRYRYGLWLYHWGLSGTWPMITVTSAPMLVSLAVLLVFGSGWGVLMLVVDLTWMTLLIQAVQRHRYLRRWCPHCRPEGLWLVIAVGDPLP